MKIIECSSYEQISKYGAEIIAQQINEKRNSVLGLATGSTPIGMYRELTDMYENNCLDFSGITTFNLDEYCGIDYNIPQSYHHFMQENLFSKVNIPMKSIHIPDASAEDAETACRNYEDAICKAGGIDIQVLGLGHDGHIGFNEPSDSFPVITHKVKLEERTILANMRFFARREDVPQFAVTMGIGTIMKARRILLLVFGDDKEEIMKRALTGKVIPQVPASVLQLHPDVTVLYGK